MLYLHDSVIICQSCSTWYNYPRCYNAWTLNLEICKEISERGFTKNWTYRNRSNYEGTTVIAFLIDSIWPAGMIQATAEIMMTAREGKEMDSTNMTRGLSCNMHQIGQLLQLASWSHLKKVITRIAWGVHMEYKWLASISHNIWEIIRTLWDSRNESFHQQDHEAK